MQLLGCAFVLATLAQGVDWKELWRAGARAEAIDALAAEVERRPDDLALRRDLVRYEVAVHRYVAALEHMKPLGGEVRAMRAVSLFRVGDYENALLHLHKTDINELLMRIDALEALGRFEECDAEVLEARAGPRKDDARVLACDGRRLMRKEEPAQAAAVFRLAVAADPWNGEALFGLGRALIASGERDAGLEAMKRHRELSPKLDRLDFARRSVDLAPAHAPNHTALGDAERELGRLDRAEDAYRRAAELAKCPELVPNTLRHARLLAEDRREPEKAVEMLLACAERCPDARLHVRAGDLYREMQRPQDARASYERALALRPDDAKIRQKIAEVKE